MASVSKRKWTGPDGKPREAWNVRWKDATGSHRQKTFEKKKEADKYRAFIEVEIHDGKGVSAPASYSLADLCADFLKASHRMHAENRLATGTVRKEQFYFDRHIVPALGDIALRDLSDDHVDKWLRGLKDTRLRGAGQLKPATIKQLTQALGRALDYAVRRKMIARNIAKDVGAWREHRPGKNEPIRTFTLAEAKALLASIQHVDRGNAIKSKKPLPRPGFTRRGEALARCTIYLAAFCGLRLGEVLGLTWQHVDFDKGIIRVRHSLDAWDNLKGPKTKAGVRDVPMPTLLAQELRDWMPYAVGEPRGLIFRTRTGCKLTTASYHRNVWQPTLDGAGLGPDKDGRRFHYHALRHFAASMMIAGNIPLPDVAQLLGHSSFDMTLQVYAHPVIGGDRKHAAVEAMAITLRTENVQDTHGTTQAIEFAA